jgi:putative transposase
MDCPNQVWSWDITSISSTVRNVCLYLYLVLELWCPKVVPLDVAEVLSFEILADLVQRACLTESYLSSSGFDSRQCDQPTLILHPDKGNTIRSVTPESGLEEMGLLRSFSSPRFSSDNLFSESLFRTVIYLPVTSAGPLPASKRPANGCQCLWIMTTTGTTTAV